MAAPDHPRNRPPGVHRLPLPTHPKKGRRPALPEALHPREPLPWGSALSCCASRDTHRQTWGRKSTESRRGGGGRTRVGGPESPLALLTYTRVQRTQPPGLSRARPGTPPGQPGRRVLLSCWSGRYGTPPVCPAPSVPPAGPWDQGKPGRPHHWRRPDSEDRRLGPGQSAAGGGHGGGVGQLPSPSRQPNEQLCPFGVQVTQT